MASTPNQVSMRSSTKRPDAQPLNTSSKRFRLGEQQPPIQRQLPINSYTSASQHGQSSYGFETLNPHTTVAPIELDMPSNNIQHESTWTNTPFNTNNNFTFYQGPMGGETEDDGRHEQGNVPMSPVASADGNQ